MFGWPISGFHIVGFEIYFLTNPCFTPEGFGRVAVLIPPFRFAARGAMTLGRPPGWNRDTVASPDAL